MKYEFEVLSPMAVYLASAQDIVSGQTHDASGNVVSVWGGPRGCRLTLIGETTSPPWHSSVGVSLARSVDRLRLQWRIWVPRREKPDHDALQKQMLAALAEICVEWRQYPDRNGVSLLQPDVDLVDLQQEAMRRAARISNEIWSDSGLRRECRERAEHRNQSRGR